MKQLNTFVVQSVEKFSCLNIYHCTSSSVADRQLAKWLSTSSMVKLAPKLFPHIGHWETALWLASGSVFNACGEGCLPLVPRSTEVSDSTLQLLMLALLSFLISGIMIFWRKSLDIGLRFLHVEHMGGKGDNILWPIIFPAGVFTFFFSFGRSWWWGNAGNGGSLVRSTGFLVLSNLVFCSFTCAFSGFVSGLAFALKWLLVLFASFCFVTGIWWVEFFLSTAPSFRFKLSLFIDCLHHAIPSTFTFPHWFKNFFKLSFTHTLYLLLFKVFT